MKATLIIIMLMLIMVGSLGIYGRNRNIQQAQDKMKLACFGNRSTPACVGQASAYVKASQSLTGNE